MRVREILCSSLSFLKISSFAGQYELLLYIDDLVSTNAISIDSFLRSKNGKI